MRLQRAGNPHNSPPINLKGLVCSTKKSKHIKFILILNIYLKNKHKIYDLGVQS